MDELKINSSISIRPTEFVWTFVRSSGPGGQNVNKVNSKAVLRWPVRSSASLPEDVRTRFLTRFASRITVDGEILISSQRYRDQGRNVDDCLEKLRELVTKAATRPKSRRPTKPRAGDVQRRLDAKKISGAKKKARRRTEWD